MKIEFTEKRPKVINLSQLKTGDLFKFAGNTDLVYMRLDEGYVNLNCGSEIGAEFGDDNKHVVKLEGQLTVWEV